MHSIFIFSFYRVAKLIWWHSPQPQSHSPTAPSPEPQASSPKSNPLSPTAPQPQARCPRFRQPLAQPQIHFVHLYLPHLLRRFQAPLLHAPQCHAPSPKPQAPNSILTLGRGAVGLWGLWGLKWANQMGQITMDKVNWRLGKGVAEIGASGLGLWGCAAVRL